MQLKGRPGSCYRALGSPYASIGSAYRPSVPLMGALFTCLVVGGSPGFNCIAPPRGLKVLVCLRAPSCGLFLAENSCEKNILCPQ